MSKRQKRILSIVLALSMIASMTAPGTAYTADTTESGTSSGLYADSTEETYTITMVNGFDRTAQETYREGDRVAVQAGTPFGGMKFTQWTSSGGGTFDDPFSTATIFTMPAENVTLTANMVTVEVVGYYRVTFDLDGGTLADKLPDGWTQEGDLLKGWIQAGKIVRPPAIYRYGYTLKKWDQPFEEIESDTVYTAIWTREGTGFNPKPDTSKPDTPKPDTSKPTGYTWEKTGSGYSLKAPDGSYVSGWAKVDGKWYYCKDGIMQQGWLAIGSVWYYLTPSGEMAVGWQKVSNTWYYFTGSGAMKTGWLQEGSTWYYLNPSGEMAVGWQKVGNTWYYFTGSGAMKTGWLQEGSTWYYLTPSGAMAVGWNWIDGKCYYFYESGKMAANTKIGGYRLNKSGQWVR